MAVVAVAGYRRLRDENEELRTMVSDYELANDTLARKTTDALNSLATNQEEMARLRDLNKALAAPSLSIRTWISKQDSTGRQVLLWQTGQQPPTVTDLSDGSHFLISMITNTGPQAVDLTWYTIESRSGYTMARAYSDGPQTFFKKVPLRIQPYSEVSVGIDLQAAAVYARKVEGHYVDRIVMRLSFAGLPEMRGHAPFDFNQMPSSWQ